MPTYAENAHRREVAERRRASDAVESQRHAQFDLQKQDKTAKFERPVFSVVGEGSRTANENYARNFDRIFGLSSRRHTPSSASRPSSVGAAVAAG